VGVVFERRLRDVAAVARREKGEEKRGCATIFELIQRQDRGGGGGERIGLLLVQRGKEGGGGKGGGPGREKLSPRRLPSASSQKREKRKEKGGGKESDSKKLLVFSQREREKRHRYFPRFPFYFGGFAKARRKEEQPCSIPFFAGFPRRRG